MGLYNTEIPTTRVNYNLPTSLVNRVKEYSKNMGIPITYGVISLLNKGLDSDETLKVMSKINEMYQEYKSGKFSDIVSSSTEITPR